MAVATLSCGHIRDMDVIRRDNDCMAGLDRNQTNRSFRIGHGKYRNYLPLLNGRLSLAWQSQPRWFYRPIERDVRYDSASSAPGRGHCAAWTRELTEDPVSQIALSLRCHPGQCRSAARVRPRRLLLHGLPGFCPLPGFSGRDPEPPGRHRNRRNPPGRSPLHNGPRQARLHVTVATKACCDGTRLAATHPDRKHPARPEDALRRVWSGRACLKHRRVVFRAAEDRPQDCAIRPWRVSRQPLSPRFFGVVRIMTKVIGARTRRDTQGETRSSRPASGRADQHAASPDARGAKVARSCRLTALVQDSHMQALIFDLDGTLIDTVYAHVFAWQSGPSPKSASPSTDGASIGASE